MTNDKVNISISDFCKSLGMNRNVFIHFLIEKRFIYIQFYGKNNPRRKNISYPQYTTKKNGLGYFEMNERNSNYNEGHKNINIQITPRGRCFFKELLEKEGLINGNIKY